MNDRREVEAAELLSTFEIRSDDIYALKEVATFFTDQIADPSSQSKAILTKEFNKSHSSVAKSSAKSVQEERADYYIWSNEKPQKKHRK